MHSRDKILADAKNFSRVARPAAASRPTRRRERAGAVARPATVRREAPRRARRAWRRRRDAQRIATSAT